MRHRKSTYIFIFFLIFFFSKNIAQDVAVEFKNYKIVSQLRQDSNFIQWLIPYADSMHRSMNKVIGFSVSTLINKQPESSLGNFMADCMKAMAEKKFNQKIDAAFMNFGGIRSYISKGDITIGKVYELMPFDNLIVLQKVKGMVLKSFLDKTAASGGWPLSGITMRINNRKATDIWIDKKPLKEDADYIIANTDYVANGGDDCIMLKNIPKQNIGYLLRDALIEYILLFTQQSKPIEAKMDNRIVYVN
jgi:2',3'-cyclic-nucleotide 2'-phosphodiesterase (5'-nucleotidase family)